ncbi:hypothetical protein [Streptomyces sp. CBMA123]|uniref:hypothetical protein n=1 Tax=Streptomyces sp. CBMA123 TaxID=1896313 RepID=UPI0016620A00|nr:hypothetical protein [Streptomyces sp. CBMA123]MBD0694161.1 hypothetical protein [Streptomyces sp. CBMA123]
MSEFDREQAHRKAENLSHLKDDVAEKNTEHIKRAQQDEDPTGCTGPETEAVQRPQGPRRGDPVGTEQARRES